MTELKIKEDEYCVAFSEEGIDLKMVEEIAKNNIYKLKDVLNYFGSFADEKIKKIEGDMAAIKQEIERLKSEKPSKKVKKTIARYSASLENAKQYYVLAVKRKIFLCDILKEKLKDHEEMLKVNGIFRGDKKVHIKKPPRDDSLDYIR